MIVSLGYWDPFKPVAEVLGDWWDYAFQSGKYAPEELPLPPAPASPPVPAGGYTGAVYDPQASEKVIAGTHERQATQTSEFFSGVVQKLDEEEEKKKQQKQLVTLLVAVAAGVLIIKALD